MGRDESPKDSDNNSRACCFSFSKVFIPKVTTKSYAELLAAFQLHLHTKRHFQLAWLSEDSHLTLIFSIFFLRFLYAHDVCIPHTLHSMDCILYDESNWSRIPSDRRLDSQWIVELEKSWANLSVKFKLCLFAKHIAWKSACLNFAWPSLTVND